MTCEAQLILKRNVHFAYHLNETHSVVDPQSLEEGYQLVTLLVCTMEEVPLPLALMITRGREASTYKRFLAFICEQTNDTWSCYSFPFSSKEAKRRAREQERRGKNTPFPIGPSIFMTDNERAFWNALRSSFPCSTILGTKKYRFSFNTLKECGSISFHQKPGHFIPFGAILFLDRGFLSQYQQQNRKLGQEPQEGKAKRNFRSKSWNGLA